MLAAITLLTTACNAGSKPNAVQLNPQSVSSKPASVAAKYLQISPAPGTANASPSSGITVNALQGAKLASVTVKSDGDTVHGSMNSAGTAWHNDWTLSTGQSYTVTATGTDSGGHPVTSASTFKTLTPSKTFHTTIFEGAGVTYGVGMAIMLTFDHAITNKAAVERALQVTTSKPVIGAWYWDGDTQVDFRPRDYWPAYTKVSLTAHLDGIDSGGGRYGTHNLTQSFSIGRSLVAVASTVTHKTQIYLDGALKYTWPISTGRDTMPTPNGTYLSEEKANPVRMIGGTKGKPDYYNELVNFAVRFTYSGDYYHSAPWSVDQPGHLQRQPRLREPRARGRRDLLQHVDLRRPDHHHRQPEGRQLGQRLDSVVLVLDGPAQGQRHGEGRGGQPVRELLRGPVLASGGPGFFPGGRSSPGNYLAG